MALELQQKQKMTISGRMIQSSEVLQMTAQELSTYINDLMLENPVIDLAETDEDGSEPDSIDEQQLHNFSHEEYHYLHQRQNNDDEYDFKDSWNIDLDDGETLQEFLWAQLVQEDYTSREIEIIHFMLACIDDKGYLSEDIEFIAGHTNSDVKQIKAYLKIIQGLEPAGVGARTLQESLKLQLERRGGRSEIMERLIDECLEMVKENKIPAIARKLRISTEEAAGYCQIIKALNPKPGSGFNSRERLRYIIPDVVIMKFKDHFNVTLNENIYPHIEINSYYSNMLKNQASKEVADYLVQKMQQAKWVKQCLAQRNQTLMEVAKVIMEHQEEFFERGIDYLKPFRMADAAEILGIHESTVSRAVSKKYLQCTWGIFPMNYFFSRGVMKKPEKENTTAAKIKNTLKEIVAKEDKKKPFSDRILAEMLLHQGINISRRTVAKYREEEGIPGTSGRKEYS